MDKKIKLVIVGNCQAAPLGRLLTFLNDRVDVTAIATVHKLDSSNEGDYSEFFDAADLIITQKISDNYQCEFVRTKVLEEKFPTKILKIVNLFYSGYHPDWIYLKGKNNKILTGPMTDYHNSTILDGWKNSLSIDEVQKNLTCEEYNLAKYGGAQRATLEELKIREQDVDISITDYIEDSLKKNQLFYTFNHPSKKLLAEYAVRILKCLELSADMIAIESFKEPLDRVILPINPISQLEKVERIIKGVSYDYENSTVPKFTNSECYYSESELVSLFFSVYDSEYKIGNL